MKAAVVLNAHAGMMGALGEVGARQIERQLAEHGIGARVHLAVPGQLAGALRSAAATNSDFIWVGGGDGSVRTAASVLAGDSRPLAVLPLGTLNHFAKDLGIPSNIPQAIAALASGRERKVDVAEVNGHIFINNAQLGLYPSIVIQRELARARMGRSKWPALGGAVYRALQRRPLVDVWISVGKRALMRRTPFVFIGNNLYETRLPTLGSRTHLDRGELCLFLADEISTPELFALGLRTLCGHLDGADNLEMFRAPHLSVASPAAQLGVALDGEVKRLRPPLHFRTLPSALRVMVPRLAVS